MNSGPDTLPLVLLVEDNETIRNAFSILLEESGYRILQAESGEEALRVSVRESPDLILLDLGLPDLSGLEVTRMLKSHEDTREIPVVALTGRALETDRAACLAAGCVAYLTKPIDTEQLLHRLPEFLAREPQTRAAGPE